MGVVVAVAVPHPPLIIPEVGGGREREIQDTVDAYGKAAGKIAGYRPETIVLLSPHHTMYADYFQISQGDGAEGDFGSFGAGEVKIRVSYDREFVRELGRLAGERKLPAGTLGERERRLDHGTMVPLYFVNQYFRDYRLVRIGLSGLPLTAHYELGQCIREAAENLDRRIAVIASGDLSHRLKEEGPYGFQKEGPEYDERVMTVLGAGNFGELFDFSEEFCSRAGECGHRAFVILAGALDQTAVTAEKLSYEGPFGVGYGVCVYEALGEDPARNYREQFEERRKQRLQSRREQEDGYVRLARGTIEEFIGAGRRIKVPRGLPEEMYRNRAGVFVSLHKEGQLRGCIGTIRAVQASVAEEIIENAVSAASGDPRFSPVEPEELELLEISVDVLGDAERIDSPEELDVKRYGVIVSRGSRQGLLLPNLDGVDTVEEQIAIAKKKAGIREDEEAELYRFEVVRHY